MRNKLTKFLTSECPPKGMRQFAKTWKYAACMLLAFFLGIGQMWGDDWTAVNIVANSGAGTTKSHITVSSPGITSTTSAQIWKDGGTAKSETTLQIGASTTSDYSKTKSYVEIKAEKGYAIGTTLNFRGGSNDSNDKNCVVVWWTGKVGATFTGYQVVKLNNKNITASASANYSVTLPANTRVVRIYRQVTFNSANTAFGTGNTVGDGKAYFASVTATSVVAPEIEGDAEMLKSETIPFVGYPAGGTWAVTSGSATINPTSGALTSGSTSGDVVISYTVDAKSGSHTVTVLNTDSKTICWDFTQGTMPTASGVTATGNGEFNAMGYNLATANTNFAYIDVEEAGYVITAATLTVFPGGTGSKYFTGDFNASLTDAISTTEGEFWRIDKSISDSEKNTEVNLGAVSSVPSGATAFRITKGNTGTVVGKVWLTLEKYVPAATHTLAWDFDGGSCSATAGDDYTAGGAVAEGATITYPAANTMSKTNYLFDGWSSSATTMPTTDLTITAQWATAYTVTFASNGGGGTMDPIQYKADAEVTIPACDFTPGDAYHAFTHWAITGVAGKTTGNPGETFDMPAGPVTLTAQWAASYGITKGSHTNGDFTIDPTSAAAGTEITLAATPDEDYLFGAWEVVKTSDGTDAGVTVTNNKFEMPAYAVTVNATFVADTRAKVLYVTNNNETTTKASDKLYEALKDDYRVTIVGPASTETVTNYALVVLHESVGGSNYNATAVAAAKGGAVPVLNTKSYFYNDGRWNWGTPNAGKTIKGATLNSAYCNIASHPLFAGVTVSDGFFEITNDAAAKCMQPIGSFVAGKEGYTLATTPNNDSGEGCAIHELTPAQRGASAGKYLMISVSNDKLNALNANGQKLFQNAAAYLIDGTASWTPVVVPTSPVVAATPTENYTEGGTITLTASAEGTSASTVYTWYKGADWATASATTPVQAASTSGATFSKTAAVEDAGTYWCNISNGTSCDAQASVTITVSSASTPTHTISYDNVKGADMTAYPTEYTEGIGVASFDPLADITGWHFVEWSPASIATDATTDQTITAVWAQVFEVTFNLQGHGAEIAKQDIISGEKATEPTAPSAIGYDFGGWYTDEECTAGNEFDFNTLITAATPLYAKWTAFDGCAMLYPATSGTGSGEEGALAVDDVIAMQTGSFGGTMKITNLGSGAMSYTSSGLAFASKSGPTVSVVLNNEMSAVAGTQIQITLVAGGEKTRGLTLKKANGDNISAFTCWVEGTNDASNGAEETFTYIVQEGDGLDGTNEFQLARNNTVYLKSLKVINCGDAIVYHNVTSAVDPAGKGTVTLGASTVREGSTTTAEYSAIDPLYEFVNWTVSGTGASVADATANPATITVGTEDAVVTLNLRLIPVKFTVEYYDGATLMGSEQVAVNENPTASEIVTAKRHYTFLGWSDTDGGDVVALNTITRTEAGTVTLYAKYEAVVCPTSGTIFSMESDEAKKPASTVTIAKDASIDLAEYATISGGNAMIINGETSGKDAISTDGEFLLKATKEVMKIELNCVLQEGDIIRVPDNSAKLVISTSNSKTGTYQAFADKNTHEFAVTAAWAGVDDIYVLYDGSSLKFTKVYVIRPAKYDVSFNMMGHGSAIADLEDVVEGSKITAPSPAPTDVDYSFAGWYKENTLENEWNFDVDVVTDNITLYAKWLDKSDATLKSLKYGTTEIELQAGVYTYAVELPSLTTAVPALTAETNNPNATAAVTNAAEFDVDGNASSTVEVTPEKEGAAHQTYTVNFTKLPSMPLLDVEESIVWDFANAGTQNNTFTDEVLANFPGVTNNATFRAQTLKATGAKIKDGYLQGTPILFHATKAGLLRVEFANTGGSTRPYRYLVVNGERTAYKSNNTTHVTTAWIEVPAGDVTIEGECVEDANGACTSDNLNFYKIEFLAENTARARALTVGNLGTTCIENACIVRGAEIYEIKGKNDIGKIVFDQLDADEVLEAGHPYVMVAKEANIRFFNTIADPATEPYDAGNGLIGTFEQKEFAAGEASEGLYFFKDHALWAAKETGMTIPAYRCYLNMNAVGTFSGGAPAPGRRRITMDVHGQNAATGIGNVQGDEVQSTKVLINGQLFILRGEKMYDATGRMVK